MSYIAEVVKRSPLRGTEDEREGEFADLPFVFRLSSSIDGAQSTGASRLYLRCMDTKRKYLYTVPLEGITQLATISLFMHVVTVPSQMFAYHGVAPSWTEMLPIAKINAGSRFGQGPGVTVIGRGGLTTGRDVQRAMQMQTNGM